ncbi:DUF3081 family protein [Ferrimonas gelatinilytica]|uniref:DUF3081 domain-containing protein n=1 Tax=Ferrimonas gelatinilytica TaxID=1255257 RepID=A0ABP9S3T6_9GAMM
MKNRLDVRMALRICDKTTRYGEKAGESYHLHGVTVEPLVDGYSVAVQDAQSKLLLQFHNRYQLDSEDEQAMTQFLQRLEWIDQHY